MKRTPIARIIALALLGILPCFLAECHLSASRGDTAEGTPTRSIEDLLADLGSNRFETREEATRALKERVDAIPSLRKARQSTDLEVRRRVDDILAALERNRALHGIGKAKALGKAGRAIEVADRLAFAAKCGVVGDEGWASLTQLADQVISRTERSFPPNGSLRHLPVFPAGDFRLFVKLVNPKEIAEAKIEIDSGNENPGKLPSAKELAARRFLRENCGGLLLRGEEVSLPGGVPQFGLGSGMIAASGDVQVTGAMSSVIVAGGNVKIAILYWCIIICDGNVELLWPPKGSVIVARGKVTCANGPLQRCLVRSGNTLRLPNGKTIDLKDGTPDPLAFVKFFELADVGLVGEDLPPSENSDTKGVRLKDVRKDSPFASGLRAGDVITAFEEKKTPTTEIFRRLLRRKLAEGEPIITFTVQRAGKTLNVPIAIQD